MYDLIIRNGRIVDGTGGPEITGDVAILDGRIAAIGNVSAKEAAHATLDAKGHVVCPGFVDVHTHYDAQVFWDGTLSPSCYHGVTTIFGGHCGFSIAPLSKQAAPYLLRMLSRVEGMPETAWLRVCHGIGNPLVSISPNSTVISASTRASWRDTAPSVVW